MLRMMGRRILALTAALCLCAGGALGEGVTTPTDLATPAPTETQTEAPAEMPAEAPEEMATEVPTEMPAE